MRLIERDADLPAFAVFHFNGHWFDHGVQIAEAVRAASGEPRLPIRPFPWWLVKAASPFVETFREMLEMTYLWRAPLRLDNRRLVAFLGEEPHTPTPEGRAAQSSGARLPGVTPVARRRSAVFADRRRALRASRRLPPRRCAICNEVIEAVHCRPLANGPSLRVEHIDPVILGPRAAAA
ncbi:MAG: hypothetical protein WDM92_08055 [Caulobacteraceae bacterium]